MALTILVPIVEVKWNVSLNVSSNTMVLSSLSNYVTGGVYRWPAVLRSPSEELEAGMPRGTGPSALC